AQVSRIERGHSRNVGLDDRINRAIRRIHRKQHGAFESMADRKNFRQHWQSLFGTVLFVSTKQNDVFSFTRTFASIIDHPIGRVRCSDKKDHQNSNRTRKESGEIHWGSFIPVSLKDSNEKAVSETKRQKDKKDRRSPGRFARPGAALLPAS